MIFTGRRKRKPEVTVIKKSVSTPTTAVETSSSTTTNSVATIVDTSQPPPIRPPTSTPMLPPPNQIQMMPPTFTMPRKIFSKISKKYQFALRFIIITKKIYCSNIGFNHFSLENLQNLQNLLVSSTLYRKVLE